LGKIPKDIGWIGIITKVFNNSHSLAITAIATTSSAVVYAIAYLYNRIVLISWNIPTDFIQDVNNKATIYYIVFGVLSLIGTLVVQIILRFIFSDLIIELYFIKILKRILKILERNLKCLDKKRRKGYRRKLMESQRSVRRERRRLIMKLGKYLIAFCLMLLFMYFMFQIMTIEKFNPASLIIETMLILITIFASTRFQVKTSLLSQKPKIYALLRKSRDLDNNLNHCAELITETQEELEEWKSGNVKSSNKLYRIVSTVSRFDVYGVIASIIVVAFSLVVMGFIAPRLKNSFWIYEEDDGKTYAAVYFNGEKAVFKSADIDGDNIQINLKEQKYEQYDNKYMVYRAFNSVDLK